MKGFPDSGLFTCESVDSFCHEVGLCELDPHSCILHEEGFVYHPIFIQMLLEVGLEGSEVCI